MQLLSKKYHVSFTTQVIKAVTVDLKPWLLRIFSSAMIQGKQLSNETSRVSGSMGRPFPDENQWDFRVWSEFCQHPPLPEEQDPKYPSSTSKKKLHCLSLLFNSLVQTGFSSHGLVGETERNCNGGRGKKGERWLIDSHIIPKHNLNCGDEFLRSWCQWW